MAAGSQATRQGWRWSYKTLGIFDAIFFVLFVCLYEETKYIPIITGQTSPGLGTDNIRAPAELDRKPAKTALSDEPNNVHHELDFSIPPTPWQKRLALATPTPESILPSYYRPFYVLFSFPAVLFTALQYAAGVVWLTIMSSVLSLVFPLPPYSFSPEQIGFMSAGPFIGHLLGAVYGGFLGDWSILYYSRKNRGFYEPEMRLYILHIPTFATAGGLIMFGVTVSRVGLHFLSCHRLYLRGKKSHGTNWALGNALDIPQHRRCSIRFWSRQCQRRSPDTCYRQLSRGMSHIVLEY